MEKTNIRRTALDILMRMEGADGGYSNILTDSAIKKYGITGPDRALLTRLVNGVTERRITLDYYIAKLAARSVPSIDPDILQILRLGVYQLCFADRIPAFAAVNETVSLADVRRRGFVNGVLRACQRQGAPELPSREKDPVRYLSVAYSLPRELVKRFTAVFGAEKSENIFKAYFRQPELTLRTNTLKITREELAKQLTDSGFTAENTPDSPFGLKISGGDGLPSELGSGLAFVQDEASQLCAYVLGAQPGEKILDSCACPGSKSFSAALMMQNRGEILSCDLHESKLPLITSGAERLGISVIKTAARDSSKPCPEFREGFDRVLCDVPCSGYGVISKKPEIRYKPLAEVAELPGIQYSILCSCSEAVKPGGVLVYSTCTLLPEENGENARRFLAEHSEFSAEPFTAGGREAPDGMLTLTPDGGTDGFFIAKFRKNGKN